MHNTRRTLPSAPSHPIRLLIGICFVCILLSLSGCCGPTALERDYGKSWAYNQAVQLANPEAGKESTPATGLTPKAGENIMKTYDKSFSGKAAGGGTTSINLGPMMTGGGGSQ